MSVKRFSTYLGIFLFTLIVASFLNRPNVERSPASQTPPQKAPAFGKALGKHDRMMDVSIETVGELPESSDGDFEVRLRARVLARQNVAGELEYKWVLPSGVHVVAGQVADGWHGLSMGQERVSEITVTGLSREELKTILFDASTQVGSARIGASAAFTTQPENFTSPIEATAAPEALRDTHL